MSQRQIKHGSTDQSVTIRIIDSTDGSPEEGVEHNSSGIALWYRREGTGTKQTITPAALSALSDAHSDGGVEHIDDGCYRLDVPDAAFASGSVGVTIGGTVTGMILIPAYVALVAVDPQDATRFGLTALPNAAAEASGGLPTLSAAQASNGTINANVHRWLTGTPNALQSGRVDSRPGAIASGILAASTFAADFWTTILSTLGLATGNLDSQLGAKASQTSVDDLPTNAELTTALSDLPTNAELTTALGTLNDLSAAEIRTALGMASADLDTQLDALATLIAGLNDLSAAEIRTALGLATANLDTQLADLPTVAEFEARTLAAASYGTAANVKTAMEGVGSKLTELHATLASAGVFSTPALANAPAGGGGSDVWTEEEKDDLIADIAALSVGAGSGPIAITVVTEPNALVSALKNGILSGWGIADEDGEKVLQLTAGVHEFRSALVGFTGDAVDHDVTADDEVEVPLTALTPTTHTNPDLSIGHYVTYGVDGKREAGVSVTATLKTWPDGSVGDVLDDGGWTKISDENAEIAFGSVADGTGLLRGAVYKVKRGDSGRSWDVTVPDAGSFNMDTIAGSP